ncbi:MAG: chemotaxis response regulator protein-glutamate methylesterase [Lachnospiraceae bacterium]|nr:chemotaxis response regulator protein-glutamate methylesterase [Lachnospiraceae bacterium]
MGKIRVLVVEDSLMFQELLVRNLNKNPDIQVVATARDPFEARDAIIAYKPDVMTLDVELPKMSGIEFLQRLMPQYPMPVVVISALNDRVFEALNAGAVDFVAKPVTNQREQVERFICYDLPDKIRTAAVAHVGTKKIASPAGHSSLQNGHLGNLVVAIGASTGGTEAISSVIREFDEDFPGVVVVQHMPAGFTQMYANRLNEQCRMLVKEARTGDVVMPGQVLIAPGGDAHMELVKVNGNYQVVCKRGNKVNGHCPSVDVLFRSVAAVAGKQALGIILTGMGGDGAKGLLEMKMAGAKTIGQDESTCVVYGMPKVAYDIGAVDYREKLIDIPKRTYQLLNKM